jgi:transcription elongation factor GreA
MIFDFIKKKEKYNITKEKKEELTKELKKLRKELEDAGDRMEESRRNDSDEDGSMLGIIGEEKQSIEKSIREIEDILKNHTIIEDKEVCEPNTISIGSEIKVKEGDQIKEYKLVTPLEADPLKNYISTDSPLGEKLLKAKKGDKIKVKVRDNTLEYEIVEIC